MKKKILVFSLGGSLIVPNTVDYNYLHTFKSFIHKLKKNYHIVLVTGGGKTARNYIQALQKEHTSEIFFSLVGIMSTKLNARLVAGFFNLKENIPDTLKDVKKQLDKQGLVVCGALGCQPEMTSDGDAAQIAEYLHASLFVNLTNVDGLYDKNPHKYENAQLIPALDHTSFMHLVMKIKYEAGQHFVLDQAAAKIIAKAKIPTLILHGNKVKQLFNYLAGKRFIGTIIS